MDRMPSFIINLKECKIEKADIMGDYERRKELYNHYGGAHRQTSYSGSFYNAEGNSNKKREENEKSSFPLRVTVSIICFLSYLVVWSASGGGTMTPQQKIVKEITRETAISLPQVHFGDL